MTELKSTIVLYLVFIISTTIAGDTIIPSQPLVDGKTLVSAGGNFVLGFFSTSAVSKNRYVGIWYNKISIQTVVWVANRQNPVTGANATLSVRGSSSLVITDTNSTVIWSSPATNGNNPVAQLLDNGNFVIRETNGSDGGSGSSTVEGLFAWQSFDYPTDTLLPGMKLGWNLTAGLNRNLTSWASPTDPSPGPYCVSIDIGGDPQTFLRNGPVPLWRGGPWNGLRFTGIPMMKTYSAFNFSFVDTEEEVYYAYHLLDPSIITRLMVFPDGTAKRLVWLNETALWNVFWFAPNDQCDSVSPCGPFGVCDANDSPICGCLQGFVPRSPANWALRDGRDGCARETPLDCLNGTDGFMKVGQAKLPDTATASMNVSMSLEECRARCLMNCSCTAYAQANISGSGSGCIIWTSNLTDIRLYTYGGQDLYIRLAAADLVPIVNSKKRSGQATIAIVVGITSGAILFASIGYFIMRKTKHKEGILSLSSHYKDGSVAGEDLELPLFDFDTIVAATNNFSLENKLGEGGFGPVYMGKLGEGNDIAVKRLAKTSVQGLDEFKNEVMLIAKLQHRNLVRLLGCCIQGVERMLVYEYMPNKSLDTFLFDNANDTALDWQTRHNIIGGVARGLVYLHEDSRYRIIHRDLKAGNILLDKDMNPKISDFGMAKIFGGDETEVNTRRVVGTYGYMSPEYAMDGICSVKSDVFSFGVLILEIISGKRNRGVYLSESQQNLLGYAWHLCNEGNWLGLVDDSFGNSFPMSEVLRCIKIGLLCVQENPDDRPTMSSIVLMLSSDNISLPDPKQPGFFRAKCALDIDLLLSNRELCTLNDMTITVAEGR